MRFYGTVFKRFKKTIYNHNPIEADMTANEKDVMLAEDDSDDLLFFQMAIQETAIPVVLRHAKNGELLFVLLKEKVPELLFLDIHLPCKDGVSCIREIRQSKEYDHLPVIMYSSSVYNKTIEECYRNAANLYLVKPDTVAQLTEKLKKVLSLDFRDAMNYPAIEQFIM